jgi:hypothetical protein
VSGIGADEVFKLEQDPGPFITPLAIYNDGSSSTFGAPNRYAAGTIEQDFGMLRCNGQLCAALESLCSVGVCNTGSGQCEAEAINEGGVCDDGNACSTTDLCVAAVCTGVLPDCSHLDDACNVGACNPLTVLCEPQPVNEGLSCDDADPCSASELCSAGVCLGTPLCEDASVCTADSCDVGVCSSVPSGICELTGTLVYYRDSAGAVEPGVAPVPGVEIDLDGDRIADATTGADGTYVAVDQAGSRVVAPLERFGDGEIAVANGAVSSLDAAMIAQHAVELITLSTNQQVAADVSGDGSITSFDAARVSQYAVQLIEHFQVAVARASDWAFFRCDNYADANNHDCTIPSYTHDPLLATETDDFYAVIYGDVTGNWAPSGVDAASFDDLAEIEVALEDRRKAIALASTANLPNLDDPKASTPSPQTSFHARELKTRSTAGARIRRFAIAVEEGESIQALDVKLSYDPRHVEIRGLETTDLTRDFDLVVHDSGGTFRAAAWSVLPLGGSGDVLVLTLEGRPTAIEGKPPKVEILANEQPFEVRIVGGKRN